MLKRIKENKFIVIAVVFVLLVLIGKLIGAPFWTIQLYKIKNGMTFVSGEYSYQLDSNFAILKFIEDQNGFVITTEKLLSVSPVQVSIKSPIGSIDLAIDKKLLSVESITSSKDCTMYKIASHIKGDGYLIVNRIYSTYFQVNSKQLAIVPLANLCNSIKSKKFS